MVTFTRRHYEIIGEMLRHAEDQGISPSYKQDWFDKWDRIFTDDNPRYQHDKFKEFVNENESDLMKVK